MPLQGCLLPIVIDSAIQRRLRLPYVWAIRIAQLLRQRFQCEKERDSVVASFKLTAGEVSQERRLCAQDLITLPPGVQFGGLRAIPCAIGAHLLGPRRALTEGRIVAEPGCGHGEKRQRHHDRAGDEEPAVPASARLGCRRPDERDDARAQVSPPMGERLLALAEGAARRQEAGRVPALGIPKRRRRFQTSPRAQELPVGVDPGSETRPVADQRLMGHFDCFLSGCLVPHGDQQPRVGKPPNNRKCHRIRVRQGRPLASVFGALAGTD